MVRLENFTVETNGEDETSNFHDENCIATQLKNFTVEINGEAKHTLITSTKNEGRKYYLLMHISCLFFKLQSNLTTLFKSIHMKSIIHQRYLMTLINLPMSVYLLSITNS